MAAMKFTVVKHYSFDPDDVVHTFNTREAALKFLKENTLYDGRLVKGVYPGTKIGISSDGKHSRLSTYNETNDTCDWYFREEYA